MLEAAPPGMAEINTRLALCKKNGVVVFKRLQRHWSRQSTLERMMRQELASRAPTRDAFAIPLSWVASTATHPDVNLGDALSAIIVAVMAGKPVRHANFDEACERIVAVGTIGQQQRRGRVHFWGTGVDATRNAVESPWNVYIRPPQTTFEVHALRGRWSAQAFRENGIDAPDVYGDPVWLLPRLFPSSRTTTELGIVVHITELEQQRAEASVRSALRRYELPRSLSPTIKLINTFAKPTVASLRRKLEEITSCKRILSTSLHGLVIAETYGIPCAWFGTESGGACHIGIQSDAPPLDHRVRDFYSGVGADTVLAYCQERHTPPDWDALIRHLDTGWQRIRYAGRDFFNVFPLPLAVRFSQEKWPVDESNITVSPL